MSSSPNGSASATRDRPTDFERRTARIFFVITFISIPALPLYDQALNHTHFIVGGGGDLRVKLGALCEISRGVGEPAQETGIKGRRVAQH